jgi:hypothetical protein
MNNEYLIVNNERKPKVMANFWDSLIERYDTQKALEIGGNYLKAQIKTDDNAEREFCRELFSSMCEARGFSAERTVYPYSFAYAKERGESDLFAASKSADADCAKSIDKALSDCCYKRDHYNIEGAALVVLNEYGFDRVNSVVGSQIAAHEYDGRYSNVNKEWAETSGIEDSHRPVLQSHAIIIDGFASEIRKLNTELDAQRFTLPENFGGDIYDDFDLYRSVIFDDGHGIALGCSGDNSEFCVTWNFNLVNGERDYTFVHAWDDEAAALTNFKVQTAKYMSAHDVQICAPEIDEQTSAMQMT